VRAWKEHGLRPFAAIAADLVAETVPRPAADVIAYIPPDGDRSLKRGHQPAADLARELAVHWGLGTAPLLERTRPVARQAGLTLAERRRNVRGAFTARPGLRAPATVVLVDDVYTTGSTVGAAASALRTAGARTVHVVTFARAVR
jgi:predicted amidophosphoribosyltransferase